MRAPSRSPCSLPDPGLSRATGPLPTVPMASTTFSTAAVAAVAAAGARRALVAPVVMFHGVLRPEGAPVSRAGAVTTAREAAQVSLARDPEARRGRRLPPGSPPSIPLEPARTVAPILPVPPLAIRTARGGGIFLAPGPPANPPAAPRPRSLRARLSGDVRQYAGLVQGCPRRRANDAAYHATRRSPGGPRTPPARAPSPPLGPRRPAAPAPCGAARLARR